MELEGDALRRAVLICLYVCTLIMIMIMDSLVSVYRYSLARYTP